MSLRPQIREVVQDLRSTDERVLNPAILRAMFLFKQSHLLRSARILARHYRDEVGEGFLRQRLPEIRTEYQVHADGGELRQEDVGLTLREEEYRAVTGALLALLAAAPHIAGPAAGALARCRQLGAVPALLDAALGDIRSGSPIAERAIGSLAEQAVGSVAEILHEGIPDDIPRADNERGTRMALGHLARLVEERNQSTA